MPGDIGYPQQFGHGGTDQVVVVIDGPLAIGADELLLDAAQQGFLLQGPVVGLGQGFLGAQQEVEDQADAGEDGHQDDGQEAYDAKYGDLEAIGCEGTWEPCHKQMLGHGIVGVENLGGDLDKVSGKRFRFFCFPIRWYMGDGSMVRCVAEIEESELNDVPERTYTYCGTGYGPACER